MFDNNWIKSLRHPIIFQISKKISKVIQHEKTKTKISQ